MVEESVEPVLEIDDHDELLAEARHAAAQITAWQARLVNATQALMQTTAPDRWRPYLAWQLGLTSSEAAELIELVDRLGELPRTRALLESGERSLRTVLAIARRATPELERTIIESTEAFTGAQLERTLREYARVSAPADRDLPYPQPKDDNGKDPDQAPEPETSSSTDRDPEPSSARWGWRDGRFHLHANFDPTDGTALHTWLEAQRARLGDLPDDSLVPQYERTCAEALLALAEQATVTKANDVGMLPDSAHVNLIIHAGESNNQLKIDRAFIPGAGPVPHWALPMLAEQGTLTTTVMVHGEPAMATEPQRFATAAQRRALLARDNGCTYPGCGATRRLIAHHIRYYKHGGPTELRNMVLLCRKHHRDVHRHAVQITPRPDAPDRRFQWYFHTEDGRPITPVAPHPGDPTRIDTKPRQQGTAEHLTHYALDVIISNWLHQETTEALAA